MTARNTIQFNSTPNLIQAGITNSYFNNETLEFEFELLDSEKNITTTIKVNPVHEGKLKAVKDIIKLLRQDLFKWFPSDLDVLPIEEELESQIEDSFEIIERQVKASSNNTNTNEERSAASIIVNLAMENIGKLFKDQYGYAFATIHNNDHDEILKISNKNEKCVLYLGRLFYRSEGTPTSSEAISNAIRTLQAEAIFESEEIPLDVRVAWSNAKREEIHYDMTDLQWRRIIISNQGWRISKDINPILFTRFNQKPQVDPDPNYPSDIFDQFLDLMHIEGFNNRLLAKTWIITLFVPDIPHLINLVFGTQGGAKSTFYKNTKKIVDPDSIELLSVPTEMMQFAQQMYHNYLAVYDNVKHIPKWFSDEICKATTGVGISKRTLFSDDDDTIYQYKRCIVINGINNVVVEPDALDRSIQMEHKRIKDDKYKEDAIIAAKFNEIRPKLLAYILDILVKALQLKPNMEKITGGSMRMADSLYWGEAISRAMGNEPYALVTAYWENTGKQSANIIENHSLAQAVIIFVDTQCAPKNGDDNLLWVGKTADLLKELSSIAIQNKLYDDSTRKYWPKRVEDLTKRLRPIIPNLKISLGIFIDISTKIGTGKDKNLSFIEIRNEGHDFPTDLRSALPALPALPSTKIEENNDKKVYENNPVVQSRANLSYDDQRKANITSKANQPYQDKTALPESPEFRAQIDESKASKASKANLRNLGTPTTSKPQDLHTNSNNNMVSVQAASTFQVQQSPDSAAKIAAKLTDKVNFDVSQLPSFFQEHHASFDLEWERKATSDDNRKRIIAFAVKDSSGASFVYNIEDFTNGDADFSVAEKALLETFIFEVYEKYPLTFGYFSTATEENNGFDSDLVMLQRALEYHDLPPIVDTRREGWIERPYFLGKIHIDLGEVYSKQNVKAIYDGMYTGNGLNDVSEGLLNKTKYEELSGIGIDDISPEERKKYVSRDAELTLELAQYDNYRIMKIMHSLTQKSRLSLPEVCHTTVSHWWSSYLQRERLAYGLPSKLEKKAYPGARVLDAKPGFYRQKTIVFDLSSMYPNIMKKFNISPETICCKCCASDLLAKVPNQVMEIINNWLVKEHLSSRDIHYWICQKNKGIIPTIIAGLIEEKVQYKKDGNKPMETAIKLYINSLYGLFGDSSFEHSDYRVAELTTSIGQIMLGDMEAIAMQHGYEIIGGDTDSIFVVNDKGQKSALIADLKTKYPYIEVESTEYRAFIITASKNYIAYPVDITKKSIVKGLKGKKSNESKWIHEIQKFVVAHAVESREKIIDYLKSQYELFISGQIDTNKLKRKIQIHKEPKDYPNMCVEKIIGLAQNKHAEDTIWYYDIDRGKNKQKKLEWDPLTDEEKTRKYQNPDLISKKIYIEDLKRTFKKQFEYIGIDFDKDIIGIGE